ncbi:unnamed protein product [Mytilus edulis]|uniref:Endonuclease/exonuclease/phosphatase domain-containing protein n=1 Tax=Mytilus edulis TaxID=6550 RepID=A0A8S3QT52_MYTED|nr:unnamed protein product [Mytilus edulis]
MASPRRSHRDKITPYRYTPSLAVAKHKARLKSKELVQPSSNITPNRTQGKTTYTKYTLNTTKAAQKMVDATEQMDVQAEFKRGTLVMKFTPAAFLMFHKHTLSFYENSTKLTAISHFKRDKNNLVVEESLSIKPITSTGIGRRQVYRINMYKTAFSVEANGRDIGNFIRNDLHEILQTLPSTSLLNKMNSIIQESCSSFLADKQVHNSIQSVKISSHDSPLIQLQNKGDNRALDTISNHDTDAATAISITPSQNYPSCPACSGNIVDYDFIICAVCDEKFHFQCQNITSDFCKSMSFDELESFQCMQCNVSLKDLSICELESVNQITEQSTNSLNSPETIVKTVHNNNEPVELSLGTGSSDHISRSNPQDHLHLNVQSIKQPVNVRAPDNITPSSQTRLDQADTTNKHTKQVAPKKQKNVKQEDLKSKLAVAEAHIAALENTVLDNNNTIRNLKLAQLGHNDSSQNRVDYLSSNPNVLTTNSTIQNCHCTQLDNRVKELEREMTNLRLINLENQMLTLRNQSQNNFHTQGPVHMVPPQPIFHATQTATPNQWMQQAQPHPFFQHGVPAPPPYMYRQSDRIPETSRQVQRPNINQQVQQAQMFNPLPSEFVNQLPTTDSNNCIAVDQSSSPHILFNQSYRNQGKGNGEPNMKLAQRLNTNQQAQQARIFNPLSRELVTNLQNSDSNNCIAVDKTLSQQILFNQSHMNQGKSNEESNMKLAQRTHIDQQVQQAQMFNPLPSKVVTNLQTSDSNNCIAVDQTSSQQILYRNQGKGNGESNMKFKVTEDESNTLSNDSKNSFAVREDLKINVHEDKYNTLDKDSKNSFAVRIENAMEKAPNSSIQDRHSTVSNLPHDSHQKFIPLIDSSATTNSKNCFAVKHMKISDNYPRAVQPHQNHSVHSGIKKWNLFFRQRTNHSPRSGYSAPCESNDVILEKASPLRIVTFNIKGFNSNKNYFNELLDIHDIILLQEHWLFNYEKEQLKQHHTDFLTFSRHVDDDEPMSPIGRPRGYGGIAILYRKSMSSMFSQLPDGNNRVQAIEISTTGNPTCLINVYLPSRGTDSGHDAYRAALDTLKEIILKYQDTHSIMIAGDFNASFIRHYKDPPR